MDKKISVVIPMFCEELVVDECYKRLKEVMLANRYNYELIFINDGSTDNTLELLKDIAKLDNNVKIINFSRNFGHQAAVSAGIENATGDAIVIIDADLQDPPEIISEMVDKWQEGYDVVYGKRKFRKGETFFKKLFAKMYYRLLNRLSSVPIPNDVGDFRLIDRRVQQVFINLPEKNKYIRGLVSWIGFKQTAVEYVREKRFDGETKYPLKKSIKLAWDGIVQFSTKPLKMIGTLGIATAFLSFLILIYAIVVKIMGGSTNGWSSLMVAITFFSSVQLISLGIMGQYIARIYDEAKARPNYIIGEKINFKDGEKDA